jgi:gluconokinase
VISIVMGVSGSGKSTVAEALALRLGAEFLDADAYHSPENVAKMSQGIPLTDADRAGWLKTLAQELKHRGNKPVVLACSALKEAYRQVLRVSSDVFFVYLKGSFEVIEARMKARPGHFMKPGMLESQFQTLEEPAAGPTTLVVDVRLPVGEIVEKIVLWRSAT